MERLTFNVGSSRNGAVVVSGRQAGRVAGGPPAARVSAIKRTLAETRERYDWDYLWMLAFTTLLFFRPQDHIQALAALDRKSTRLNSSHLGISYAVFCLKKKNKTKTHI